MCIHPVCALCTCIYEKMSIWIYVCAHGGEYITNIYADNTYTCGEREKSFKRFGSDQCMC